MCCCHRVSTQLQLNKYHHHQPSIVGDHEIPFIRETSPEEVTRLDEIKCKVVVPSQTFNIDSLFHIYQTYTRQAQQTYWHLIVTSTACAVTLHSVLYFSLCSYLRNIVTCCSSATKSLKPSTSEQDTSPLPHEPKRRAYSAPRQEHLHREVVFTTYSTQPTRNVLQIGPLAISNNCLFSATPRDTHR